jgi:uncharacterized membrane protein YgcG
MKTRTITGVVVAAVVSSFGIAVPAEASGDDHVVGLEQTSKDPNGMEIAYTVTKILPSADPVAYPVAGKLYEATVMARALQGTVVPVVPFFNAHAEDGANYPALANVSGLSEAPLQEGATTDGKIYFDVVGPVPDSVVYNGAPGGPLTWNQPVAGERSGGGSTGSSSGGAGSTGGGGGSRGVMGSTGPNEAVPTTSGGEIGGGEGGTEGGGGNLSSGGGSGAPNGDTGGGGNGGSGSGG